MFQKKDALRIARSMERSLKIRCHIEMAGLKSRPEVAIYEDSVAFYCSQDDTIHLGAYLPLIVFDVMDEAEYVAAMDYFYDHEAEHRLSTADEPYAWAVQRGTEIIIEYISDRLEKKKRRFRTDGDYEYFIRNVLPDKGFFLSFEILFSLVARILNSIEDGRIERIRSTRYPGFEARRRYFRGLVWNTPHFYPPADDLTPEGRFCILADQILSLSTCQVFTKGFLMAYAGTSMVDEAKAFVPYVKAAFMAAKTRDMAFHALEVIRLLAPYIFELCLITKQDFMRTLMKMLSEMAPKGPAELDPKNMPRLSEKEEIGNSLPSPTFPVSDLDPGEGEESSGKEAASGPEKSGGTKPEAEPVAKRTGSGKGSGAEEEERSKDSSEGEAAGSGKSEAESSGKGGEADGKADAGAGAEDGDEPFEAVGGGASMAENASEAGEEAGEAETLEDGSAGDEGSGQKGSGYGGTKSEDEILASMKEAAEKTRADAWAMSSNINEATSHASVRGTEPKTVPDTDKPVSSQEMADICTFVENKRAYDLVDDLPPVVKARGKALRRKNEKYFRSLSRPTVRYLDSGSVDPSRLFGLAFGDTEVFRKKGIDKVFDGCVYVLMDNSGSMCGEKRTEASKACAVIEEGFKGLIPMKIVAFDEWGTISHELIKGWNEVQRKNCSWNFCLHGRTGYGNEDDKDILIAQRELLKRPERRKLLIVLSDGAPSDVRATRRAIEETRKKGIDVFGIYFERGAVGPDADTFKHMYQKDFVCCSLEEVDENLSRLLYRFSRK